MFSEPENSCGRERTPKNLLTFERFCKDSLAVRFLQRADLRDDLLTKVAFKKKSLPTVMTHRFMNYTVGLVKAFSPNINLWG